MLAMLPARRHGCLALRSPALFKAWPGSIETPNSYYMWTDNGFRGGLYHAKGEITDSGVIWSKANQIAGFVDNHVDNDGDGSVDIDYKYYNGINHSISYGGITDQGYEIIFASWLDKPTSRAVRVPERFWDTPGSNTDYYDDVYFAASCVLNI